MTDFPMGFLEDEIADDPAYADAMRDMLNDEVNGMEYELSLIHI